MVVWTRRSKMVTLTHLVVGAGCWLDWLPCMERSQAFSRDNRGFKALLRHRFQSAHLTISSTFLLLVKVSHKASPDWKKWRNRPHPWWKGQQRGMYTGMDGIFVCKTIYHLLLSGHKLLTGLSHVKYDYSYPTTCKSLTQILYQAWNSPACDSLLVQIQMRISVEPSALQRPVN